jgi:hypothetical protein
MANESTEKFDSVITNNIRPKLHEIGNILLSLPVEELNKISLELFYKMREAYADGKQPQGYGYESLRGFIDALRLAKSSLESAGDRVALLDSEPIE